MRLFYIALLLAGFTLFLVACAPSRQTASATAGTPVPPSASSPVPSAAVVTTAPAATARVAAYHAISPADAKARLDAGEKIILLDVRTPEEYAEGHIKGSMLLPVDELFGKAGEKLGDRDATIFVYCRSGRRSKTAVEALVGMGYTQVYDLGGIIDWPYGTSAN